MKLTFWGVRGSLPTPGHSTIRYGGNTPSIELRLDDGKLIIFDAGSGIRNLGDFLAKTEKNVNTFILITHPHWDHIQGFPFFKPAFMPGNELTIIGTERPEKDLAHILSDQMDKTYFPVQLRDMKAKINFKPIREEGLFDVFEARVHAIFVNHPGFTVGYRLQYQDRTLVYISDNEPYDPVHESKYGNFEGSVLKKFREDVSPNHRIIDFCRGADVLIHDTTYTPEELEEKRGWGHSDYISALEFAAKAEVRKLYLFHHDHTHNDEMVDEIFKSAKHYAKKHNYKFHIESAKEGMSFEL